MRMIHMPSGRAARARTWDGTTWTGGGRVLSPPVGPVRTIVTALAASNYQADLRGVSGRLSVTSHRVVVDAHAPRMRWVYAPFLLGSERRDLPPATMRVAVSTTTHPRLMEVTVDGSPVITTPTIPWDEWHGPAIEVDTDPLPIDLYAGDELRIWAWVAGGAHVPADTQSTTAAHDHGSTPGTYEQAMATPLTDMDDAPSWRPSLVPAPSDQPAWLLTGDSIMQMHGSWGERWAYAAGVASTKSAQGGEGYGATARLWSTRYGPFLPYVDVMVDEMGVNSLGEGDGVDVMGQALDLWRRVRAAGVDCIVKPTVLPSGGKWVEGATPPRPAAVVWNQWLRDGAPVSTDWTTVLPAGSTGEGVVRADAVDAAGTLHPGTGGHPLGAGGVIDLAAAIEDPAHETFYAPDAPDIETGLHPGPSLHQRVADRMTRDVWTLPGVPR